MCITTVDIVKTLLHANHAQATNQTKGDKGMPSLRKFLSLTVVRINFRVILAISSAKAIC